MFIKGLRHRKAKRCNGYAGVTLYGGPKASSMLNIPKAHSFHHEYSSLACSVEIVDDVYSAIDHINLYGRHVTVVFFHQKHFETCSFHLFSSPYSVSIQMITVMVQSTYKGKCNISLFSVAVRILIV